VRIRDAKLHHGTASAPPNFAEIAERRAPEEHIVVSLESDKVSLRGTPNGPCMCPPLTRRAGESHPTRLRGHPPCSTVCGKPRDHSQRPLVLCVPARCAAGTSAPSRARQVGWHLRTNHPASEGQFCPNFFVLLRDLCLNRHGRRVLDDLILSYFDFGHQVRYTFPPDRHDR